ncbi:MAG TPA: alpha/beta fold hydrolase [Anaeromyxobacteraceae bacterium]|nr:alpha/beta fold hydrolase [Anaeromyxobacteraceae bacterium]
MRGALWLLLALAAVLLGLAALLVFGQRRLLFFPARQAPALAEREARRLGLEPWTEGGRFLGWRSPAPGEPRARVLVLHGNAGSALDRVYVRDVLQAPGRPPLEVLLLEYPGYGPRPGAPSERALVEAALEAVRLARRDGTPLLLWGESLGSAVAALAAAAAPGAVDGLALVTPLRSVPAVAARHYPFLPVSLVRDAFRADLALPRHPGPAAFLVAGRDEVVFPDLSRSLFDAFPGRKRLWLEEGAGHNTLDYHPGLPRWREMLAFLLDER